MKGESDKNLLSKFPGTPRGKKQIRTDFKPLKSECLRMFGLMKHFLGGWRETNSAKKNPFFLSVCVWLKEKAGGFINSIMMKCQKFVFFRGQ